MNILVLVLTALLALGEGALSVLLINDNLQSGAMSASTITAILFAAGMFLVWMIYIIVGMGSNRPDVLGYVRKHFGRTLVLMLASVVLLGGMGFGLETVYHLPPIQIEGRKKASDETDILFILDGSGSMDRPMKTETDMKTGTDEKISRMDVLLDTFEKTVNSLTGERSICVLRENEPPALLLSWTEISSDEDKRSVISKIDDPMRNGAAENDFTASLRMAAEQIAKRPDNGRGVKCVMLSDGENHLKEDIPAVFTKTEDGTEWVVIDTIMFGGDPWGESTLKTIAETSGGTYYKAADGFELDETFEKVVKPVKEEAKPDTLLTERERTLAILPPVALRILLMLVLGFVFKLICVVCVGHNSSDTFKHVLHAFISAALGACVLEFGYRFIDGSIARWIVIPVYWLLMMTQVLIGKSNAGRLDEMMSTDGADDEDYKYVSSRSAKKRGAKSDDSDDLYSKMFTDS